MVLYIQNIADRRKDIHMADFLV